MSIDHPAPGAPTADASPFGDLAANVEGDLDLLGELAGVFLRECPAMMDTMRAAVAERNPTEVEKAAHKLKGCVGVFTDRGPFECALHLEMMGRENNLTAADHTLCELENQIRVFTAEMNKCLSKPGT
ncbi:MAG: Hpt domain-containing protein [Candidatus Acidiferrales bacterium]